MYEIVVQAGSAVGEMQPPSALTATCLRSLGEALTSAAATFALFAASNWGSVHLLSLTQSLSQLLIWQALYAMGFPQLGLYTSVRNTIQVWRVKKALTAACTKHNYPHINCIAVMAGCPLFLEESESGELLRNLRSQNGALYEYHELKSKWCPLELLLVAAASKAHGKDVEADGARVHAEALEVDDEETYHTRPRTSASDQEGAVLPLPKFIKVECLEDKVALLVSGLVPHLDDLSYLRSRNWFHWVVTALQAGGYMLGIVQRLLQHLRISPIEAILLFLCLIVTLQLLMELYACSNYQRPLLLRFTHPQQVFCLNHRLQSYPISLALSRRKEVLIRLICSHVPVVLMSLPLIYYVCQYVHVSLMSALAVCVFLLAVTADSILFTKYVVSGSHQYVNGTLTYPASRPLSAYLSTALAAEWCVGLVWRLLY